MARTFYVTTPIYYVNDVPHIGHAYTTLAADTLARWHRLTGDQTWFLTGTDEHGKKIEQAAERTGISPQAHADRYAQRFQELLPTIGVANDDFIRTTEARHEAVVAEMWRRMEAAGDIYLGKYEGWYSVGDEAYFSAEELREDGTAPSGHEVSWVVEPSFFFRLSKYGDRLLEHMDANPDCVQPRSRFNEVRSFVAAGLRDISISRTNFSWGVPVPGHPDHVVYVWVDALTNYISALGGPDGELFEKHWPDVVHLLGKDILRFHAVYWPAFLMSAGLPVPKRMFAHGWWTHNGEKMSKTVGNVIDPIEMVERYGADSFRYFLLREVRFGSDGDFSEAALRNRINGDLANDYGNLLNRTLGMLGRYCEGAVPARGEVDTPDQTLLAAFVEARAELLVAMEEVAFARGLTAIWRLVSAANKYVDVCAPWVLVREDRDARLREVLYNLCETLRVLGVWTLPFLPSKAAELLDRLDVPAELRTVEATSEWGGLPSGGPTTAGEPLFPRLERVEQKAPPKKAKKKAKKSKKKAAPLRPIEYSQFAGLDLRAGQITAASKHPNADRLLVLTVDVGEPEPRTLCAGVAAAYSPDDLLGRTVVVLANLEPREIRGVVSQGMVLAAGDGASVRLLTAPETAPGAKVS